MNDGLDLCIKHLTRIRISHNTTCIYLSQSPHLLMKLAFVLEKVEMSQLQDRSVAALIQILDVLLPNKLKSFSLSNCKVEHTENLKTLLKALAKSQSLETHRSLLVDKNDPTVVSDCGACFSGNQKSHLNQSEMISNDATGGFYSGTEIINDNQENHTPSNTAQSTEDNLYDEGVFLRQSSLSDTCQEIPYVNTITMASSSSMRTSKEVLRKREITLNQLRPNCLTDLKLSSCLMDSKSLRVFSEELVHFVSLLSLELCDIGLRFVPEMNKVLTSVNELVINGSLRYLVFENESLSWQMEMFCDMLMSSCENCRSTETHKGLWSLRLVGGFIFNIGSFGKMLETCSFCEERGFAHKNSEILLMEDRLHSLIDQCADMVLPLYPGCSPLVGHREKNEQAISLSSRRQYITSGIESLYLSFHDISGTSGKELANSLLHNRSLRNISLPSCGLKTDDISCIFDSIAGNEVVRKLELRNNLFDMNQSYSLCKFIAMTHLVHLDLSYCSLEVIPDAVVVLLSSNKTLQVLLLAGNRLGDAGVFQLSDVFINGGTSVLNTLDLSCNKLTTCSLLHFGNVLSTEWPTKLRKISICENPLVNVSTVRECLNKVFDVVIMEPVVDGAMAYADYLSEM
ncbi:uncharacterized protein LOC114527059 [Dendronephthya gigantea]|uniref:uncharacterized protein LOC114527059 n=1 Tax=Dendronephthya gigantea TaxID=151771 RepID=UPI00106A1893|nr:uncharacterized protein LOC114527059 [Dendronephthya gigantea]